MSDIFKNLNPKQIEAVKIISGPVLVISGPGSGKTRCLTHRVAFLISENIKPANILAITFTNKAANEVKERVQALLSPSFSADSGRLSAWPTIGTFHSVCLRILRREISLLNYKPSFTIFDEYDRLALIKKVMARQKLDLKQYNPQMIVRKISKLKTELLYPENYKPNDFFSRLLARIYENYQTELKNANALDFDDLIALTVKIFKHNPQVLEKYQDIWKYILVDEYQDTSFDQYSLIKLLSQKYKNIFAIGDDAQSIYAFREADIRNILNFQKDYPEAKVIFLEQNYRSTKNILAVAQNIISNNQSQVPKTLWTENGRGERILVKEALNERDEADFITLKIEELMQKNHNIGDFAILYRTHAQSRAIEESFISCGLPYQIIGGIKFYERKEIKDILAYMRLAANPSDLVSFERIINIPTRGLGQTVLAKITNTHEKNLIKALDILAKENTKTKQGRALKEFYELLYDLINKKTDISVASFIKNIIKKTDYEEYLKGLSASKNDAYSNFEERMENLKELLTVAKKYDNVGSERGLDNFLEEITLLQGVDSLTLSANANKVGVPDKATLMSIHSSKGLEFPVVFIAGIEEGLFPHSRSTFNPQELEEERRLCYVAVTRAKEKLILSYARRRNIFGSTQRNLPSRFIGEMPQDTIEYAASGIDDDYEEKIYY
ncbi:MAG: Superfamily I DNA and RNA helicase [Candidatus Yanofskybacteria bacterium GW2011_GWA2_41_22]|uniref:DNA 3'-5' helicase n=5 Tax=Parcubacteria group TaxID=1794811 RepID=A0A1F8HUV6_9BACT|nr:MAG: Superfamily I DNA and RNA helicase [Candidatus Yanofskybacteria bacterium GW2011_GWA2_41_22]KKS25757.1 MAG: Superfamily I DNA and RNA helicase [Candidatus Jorgensenbacteria bacterium GW2011_GWF2_41_8]KKS27652.1 MAG: Superfamily I DNA and RNA helicase [Candidatus Yanofskybacteria bacterium GW2011_GWC2_41_9]OGM98681.1 MAG: hypothetical protein A2736_00435 [Candidatus Yanofskybacteria bacterium RIFCSPHIGHO2_01_FULL_41_27]OGN41282.1 MAG: hypothetical protein A2606_03160 [Candidatus Yanofsky